MNWTEMHWIGFSAAPAGEKRDDARGAAWLSGYDRYVWFMRAYAPPRRAKTLKKTGAARRRDRCSRPEK